MTVVVVGSLHYDIMVDAPDRPRKGETVTGERWYPKFGGKGGNQAVAASRAGATTRFVGAVGQDDFADVLRETLLKHGIATDRIATIANHGTGMSVAITDSDGDYGAVIVSGANTMIDPTQFKDPALWNDGRILILQNEVPEAVNIAAGQAAKRHGLRVCFNAAPWRELSDDLIDTIDILVVNAIEAGEMCGQPVHNLSTAKKTAIALTDIVTTAIVTVGGDGVAWSVRGQGADSREAHQVKLVSTHGAGDMFIGTLCHALAENTELGAAIDAANAAAARSISEVRT